MTIDLRSTHRKEAVALTHLTRVETKGFNLPIRGTDHFKGLYSFE
jgi:hypothetical protein